MYIYIYICIYMYIYNSILIIYLYNESDIPMYVCGLLYKLLNVVCVYFRLSMKLMGAGMRRFVSTLFLLVISFMLAGYADGR